MKIHALLFYDISIVLCSSDIDSYSPLLLLLYALLFYDIRNVLYNEYSSDIRWLFTFVAVHALVALTKV